MNMNSDVIIACADLAARAGAQHFEIGYLHDDVPVEEAGWYAHVTYRGARITTGEHPSPSGAAPVIELRFMAIEPVLDRDSIDGAPSKDTLELLHQLRDVRLGEQPALDLGGATDSPSEPGASATGGTATSRRPRRSGPGVRAGDTSVDE